MKEKYLKIRWKRFDKYWRFHCNIFCCCFAVAMLGMIPIFWSFLLFLYHLSEALFLNYF